jgi:hypothetical protein
MSILPRLLPNNLIPTSLWDPEKGLIQMPSELKTVYYNAIEEHNLLELANSRGYDDSPVGGITLEETKKHFAQSFDGSSARVQLTVLDPKNETNGTSDAFVKALAGNKVVIVDAPCGTGAAVLTFLTTMAELREKQVVPRNPLEVVVMGAEISESARMYAGELFDKIVPYLEVQGIFVSYKFQSWDARSDVSTSNLIKNIITEGNGCSKSLVVIANFSGFLASRFDEAKQQIDELLRYSSGMGCLAIWIEPQKNNVVKGGQLFDKISKWAIGRKFIGILKPYLGERPFATSSANFVRPCNSKETARVNLAVISFDLGEHEKYEA